MKKISASQLFSQLVIIPGLSGQESVMADFLKNHFDQLGWKTWLDDSGPKHDSDSGNLYALLEVNDDSPTTIFVAHMDTVIEKGQAVCPVIKSGVICSDGGTVLGADNRAGICELLLLAERLARERLTRNILFLFTTREEAGVMGSSFFAYDKPIDAIFNVDSDSPPGIFVTQSYGYQVFKIVVHGVGAHAAKEFEHGKHAIALASELILQLPLGGDRAEGWSCNVGTIRGGERTNVIPDLVILEGEVRAETKEQIDNLMAQVGELCAHHAKLHDIAIEFSVDAASYIPPFRVDSDGLQQRCAQAAQSVGLEPVFKTAYSTSDSNFLSTFRAPTISVARGGSKPHSHQESIIVSDIDKTVELLEQLAVAQ